MIICSELFHLLFIHESRLTHIAQAIFATSILESSANIITTHSNNFNPRPSYPNTNSHPTCQVCNKFGNTTLQCYHRFDQAFQYEAPSSSFTNYSSQNSFSDQAWYSNSGTTHHLTNDLSYLNLHQNRTVTLSKFE